MEFIGTISLGEALVAGGTLVLAIVTVVIAVSRTKEDRQRWRRDIQLRYEREILDGLEGWLETVNKVISEEWSRGGKWSEDSERKAYLKSRAEMAGRLVVLLDGAIVLRRKGVRAFEAYGFEEEFEKVMEKYAKYLNILHGMVLEERKIGEKDMEEESECQVELLNAGNDFSKYVIGIREMEELQGSR